MSCERTKPATVVYDDRYRIDFSLPTDMSLLSFLGDPNLLDVATRIRPTSRQSALIVMLGSDRVRDAERYLVYVTLEYSTDPQRSRPPTLERVLEHAKSRSSAEVPWSIEILGKNRWVVSDGLDLEVDFHQTDTKSWFWRNPSQTFIRPIDDDVDLHVSSEFNLNRESRPAGWLEARSACTLKFVSSISISEIKR